MPDLVHGAGALAAARTAVATHRQHVRALSEAIVPAPPGVIGGIDDGGLGVAVDRLVAALRTDLAAAGDRLAGLETALDAIERSMQDIDRRAAAALAPRR